MDVEEDDITRNLDTLWDSWKSDRDDLCINPEKLSDEIHINDVKSLTTALLRKANTLPLKDRPKSVHLECNNENRITTNGLPQFIKFLSFCQIEALIWNVDPLLSSDKNVLIFASNLHRVPVLNNLSMWGAKVHGQWADLYAPPLLFRIMNNSPTCHIRCLSMDIDKMTEGSGYGAELGNALVQVKSLEELYLYCNYNTLIHEQEITDFFERLRATPSRLLDFRLENEDGDLNFSFKAMAQFLCRQNQLKSLTVWAAADAPVESYEQLVSAIKTCPWVRDITLSLGEDQQQYHLSNDLIRHMLGETTMWQSLSFCHVQCDRRENESFYLSIDEDQNGMDVNAILNGIDSSRLLEFCLSNHDAPQMSLCVLPLFANPSCRVSKLDLQMNVEVWNLFCDQLQNYTHLTDLRLGCTEQVSYPFQNLQIRSNLQDIDLRIHSTAENWNNLGDLLGHQSTLKHLCIMAYCHQLEARAMTAFQDAVRDHACLKRLHISRYRGEASELQPIVEQILAGLEQNSALESLVFYGCFNWAASFSQLLAFLQRNKKLSKFSTTSSGGEGPGALSDGQLSQLATALHENSGLRFFADTSGGSQSWTYGNEMHLEITKALYHNWIKDVPLTLIPLLLSLAKQETSLFVFLHEIVDLLVQAYQQSFVRGKVRMRQPFLLEEELEEEYIGQEKKNRTS